MIITALDTNDSRAIEIEVAGPAALLVAKLHKLGERHEPGRLFDKDAHDVYRLLVATDTARLAATLGQLQETGLSDRATTEALDYLRQLFAAGPEALGAMMARRAEELFGSAMTVSAAASTLGFRSSRGLASQVTSATLASRHIRIHAAVYYNNETICVKWRADHLFEPIAFVYLYGQPSGATANALVNAHLESVNAIGNGGGLVGNVQFSQDGTGAHRSARCRSHLCWCCSCRDLRRVVPGEAACFGQLLLSAY